MTLAQPNRWFGLRIWVLTMAQSIRFLRFGDEGRSRKSTQDEVRAHGAIHLPQSLPASLVQSPPPFPTLLATFCPVHSIFLSPFRLLSSPASISLPSSFPSTLSLSPSLSLSLSPSLSPLSLSLSNSLHEAASLSQTPAWPCDMLTCPCAQSRDNSRIRLRPGWQQSGALTCS